LGKFRYIGEYQFFEQENKLIFDNYTHYYVVILLLLILFSAAIGVVASYSMLSFVLLLMMAELISTLFFNTRITVDSKERVIYKEIISCTGRVVHAKKIIIVNSSYLMFEEEDIEGAFNYSIKVLDTTELKLVPLLSFKREEVAQRAQDMIIRAIALEARHTKTIR
jgi:hypothetical protein